MSDSSTLRKISNGNRAYRWSAVVAPALAMTVFTAPLLPFAYDTRDNLREAYGSKQVQLVSYRSTRTATCGSYRAKGGDTIWRYVQIDTQIWAQEKDPDWRAHGENSRAGQLWNDCMTTSWAKGSAVDWITDPIIILILRST